MDAEAQLFQALTAYGAARAVLEPHLASLAFLALLQGSLQTGALELLRQPTTPAALADTLQLDEPRALALCQALDAHGIVDRDGITYHLDKQWATLLDPAAVFPLAAILNRAFAQRSVLEQSIGGADTYWSLSTEARLAIAKGVSSNPASPYSPPLLRMVFHGTSAELDTVLLAGGRCLDIGCGVAGGLLSTLQAYPAMTAVGIDIAADLLQEAQQRAVQLGVNDRVQFVHVDARTYHEPAAFDLVHWAQFFFPTTSRKATLQVALQALKPDGFFVAPLLPERSIEHENMRTAEGRQETLDRIMYQQWDVPMQTAQALQAEIQAAGFADAQVIHTPAASLICARRL